MKTGFYYVGRILLGGIFLWASWEKILEPAAFLQIMANYRILPGSLVPFTAVVLPYLEGILGVLLIAGFRTRACALVAELLLGIFTIALILNLVRGVDVACGCFSLSETTGRSMAWDLLRDGVLLTLTAWIFYAAPGTQRIDTQTDAH